MRLGISLRRRIVWLVIAATAPLFGLAFYKAVRDADTAVSRASSDLALAVSLVSTNQDRVVESAHQMLTSIVNAPGLMDMPAVACQRYFGDLNTQLPQYLNLGLVDLDGYFRCDGLTHRRVFAGNRYFFRAALERQRFVAGGYITGAVSGLPIVNFGLPMFAADGKAAAVAFVAINLTDLSRTLAGVQLPQGSRLVITDRAGLVLVANPQSWAEVGKPVPVALLQDAVKAQSGGVSEDIDAAGMKRIFVYQHSAKSPDSPFFVAVGIDKERVMAPVYHQLMLELGILALVALLGGWMAWLAAGRVIMRPALDILEATRQLEQGRLDVRIPLQHSKAYSEFGRIAIGFNSMAAALEQRERELAVELARSQQAYASLEQMQAAQIKSNTELREVERKLMAAQRLGRIGIWELDIKALKLWVSAEVYELYGVPPGTFETNIRAYRELIHPDDRERYLEQRALAFEQGSALDVEYRITTPSGEQRWIHQYDQPELNSDGEPLVRLGVVQEITQRKLADQAITRITELLKRTGALAKVGGWEWDVESQTAYCTDEIYRIYDMQPTGTQGIEAAISFYAPEAQPIIKAAVIAALKEGKSWDLTLALITATGRRIWVHTIGQPHSENGKLIRIVGVLQDVTAQRASLDQLSLLETCIARLNDIVLITEAETTDAVGPRIVFVNDAFERHTGYRREEVMGQSPRMLQGPNTQPDELRRIRGALENWQPVRSELINYTKSGQPFWIDLDMVPVADATGRFTHWVSVERNITDRKHAEQALLDSEQRYAALFAQAPVPMFVYDTSNWRFLTVNDAALSGYGYSQDEFRSMTLFDIGPASEHEALREQLAGMEHKRTDSWLHRRKDGSLLSVRIVSTPIQYAGRSARFVVALDVTPQIKAEKDMQDHLFTLQRAADAAQAITWHQTPDALIQEIAFQARGVIGAHLAAVTLNLESHWTGVMDAVSLSDKYTAMGEQASLPDGVALYAMVSENNRAVHMTQAELEAHPHWHRFNGDAAVAPQLMRGWLAVPLVGRSGKTIGLLQLSDKYQGEFTQQDEYVAIELAQLASAAMENAQLLAEVNRLNAGLEQEVVERTAALTRQEALFRALAEQAPQVVWTADNRGRLTFLNRTFFDLIGGEFSDWEGAGWFSVIHPDDLAESLALWKMAIENLQPYVGLRRMLAKDGTYHTMSYRASPVLDDHGEVAFWVGIDADITEIKATEMALRLSNQELEAFSYSVSHDLRSPLNTIDGFSRLLSKQLVDNSNDKVTHYLARIQAGVAQMGRLIEDLLSLAQVSRTEMRYETIDLSALAQAILAERQSNQPERLVQVSIETGLQAHGDVRLIRVVMENLLGNAWKFTSRKDEASIHVGRLSDAAGEHAFFVRDNGAGFDMAYADKLFTVFQRLHGVAEFPGTGVGLASVDRVIRRHGGRLWAEAQPELGATFFFTLPKKAALS